MECFNRWVGGRSPNQVRAKGIGYGDVVGQNEIQGKMKCLLTLIICRS